MSFLYTKHDKIKAEAMAAEFFEKEAIMPFLLSTKAFMRTPGFFFFFSVVILVLPHVTLLPHFIEPFYPLPGEVFLFHNLFTVLFIATPFMFQVHGKPQWIHVWRCFTFVTTCMSLVISFYGWPSIPAAVSLGSGIILQILLKLPQTNAFVLIQKFRKQKNSLYMKGKIKARGPTGRLNMKRRRPK